MWEEKEQGRHKIDAQGNLVDMTRLKRNEFKELEAHYMARWNRARSPDMRLALRECLDQIRRYEYEGELADNADIFYVADWMGVLDVRSMIKTYFGSLVEFRQGGKEFRRLFAKRTVKYSQPGIPSDTAIRLMFRAAMDEPPDLQRAADHFADDYKISKAVIEVGSNKEYNMTTIYDGKIHVSLDKFKRDIDLFEALCELLFNHLSTCRQWRFADDPEGSFLREKEERVGFATAIMERCVSLGLLGRAG